MGSLKTWIYYHDLATTNIQLSKFKNALLPQKDWLCRRKQSLEAQATETLHMKIYFDLQKYDDAIEQADRYYLSNL
jgi:hypothetical protein